LGNLKFTQIKRQKQIILKNKLNFRTNFYQYAQMLIYTFISFAIIAGIAYLMLMLRYSADWQKLCETKTDFTPEIFVSVLIAARNEEDNILNCLKSISSGDYPIEGYEIILIDDHSEDKTIVLADSLNIPNLKIIRLESAVGKKKAIEKGIAEASGTLMLCTDADCSVSEKWIKSIAALYTLSDAKFIAAPVIFKNGISIFEKFQALDFLGMMAITGAGISGKYLYMCNGANLAYPKEIFYAVGGFEGIDGRASGDDMLLMQKIAKKYPNELYFLKSSDAIVTTTAAQTLLGFWQQRIRWASKSGDYQQKGVKLQLALVWCFMLSILITGISAFFYPCFLILLTAQLIIKAIADYTLLKSATTYFQKNELLGIFFPALFMHWAYILSVGFWSNISKNYNWKGRRLK
jgi:cellulose synthase/poly-beta-1,6-N-acetylglucosamine synthase-like glycosyltransferase